MKCVLRTLALIAIAAPLAMTQPAGGQAPDPAQSGRGVAPAQAAGGRGRVRRPDPFVGQERIQALMISGGCCHDYIGQNEILMDLMADILPVDWTVLYHGGTSSDHRVALYEQPDWIAGFDIVVHNECFARIGDAEFIRKITSAHAEHDVAAMTFHCSLHSYRDAEIDDWREFQGVTSRRHESRAPIDVMVADRSTSLVDGIPASWTTPEDELYVIEKVWPNVKVLAIAPSQEDPAVTYPVIWTNDYQGARVWGTTLGHVDIFDTPEFRDAIVRGFRWAVGRP